MKILVLLCILAASQKPSALSQARTYAKQHHAKLHISDWNGTYWVEVDGLDAHGVGKTPELAARDFLYRADMLDHEDQPQGSAKPEKAAPQKKDPWVCPPTEYCT